MFSIYPSSSEPSLLCAHMAIESVPHEYRSHTILPLSNPLTIYHTHTRTHSGTHPCKRAPTHTHTHPWGQGCPSFCDRISFQHKWLKRGGRGCVEGRQGAGAATRAWMGLQMILEFVGEKVSPLLPPPPPPRPWTSEPFGPTLKCVWIGGCVYLFMFTNICCFWTVYCMLLSV